MTLNWIPCPAAHEPNTHVLDGLPRSATVVHLAESLSPQDAESLLAKVARGMPPVPRPKDSRGRCIQDAHNRDLSTKGPVYALMRARGLEARAVQIQASGVSCLHDYQGSWIKDPDGMSEVCVSALEWPCRCLTIYQTSVHCRGGHGAGGSYHSKETVLACGPLHREWYGAEFGRDEAGVQVLGC